MARTNNYQLINYNLYPPPHNHRTIHTLSIPRSNSDMSPVRYILLLKIDLLYRGHAVFCLFQLLCQGSPMLKDFAVSALRDVLVRLLVPHPKVFKS